MKPLTEHMRMGQAFKRKRTAQGAKLGQALGMADGGLLGNAIKGLKERSDKLGAAEAAPVGASVASTAPMPSGPAMPQDPLTAQLEKQAAERKAASAAAPPAPTGIVGKLRAKLGMANGGLLSDSEWNRQVVGLTPNADLGLGQKPMENSLGGGNFSAPLSAETQKQIDANNAYGLSLAASADKRIAGLSQPSVMPQTSPTTPVARATSLSTSNSVPTASGQPAALPTPDPKPGRQRGPSQAAWNYDASGHIAMADGGLLYGQAGDMAGQPKLGQGIYIAGQFSEYAGAVPRLPHPQQTLADGGFVLDKNQINDMLGATPRLPHPQQTLCNGGRVRRMSRGGKVDGPGGPTEDKIPAMLSAGEYVLPADTVAALGVSNLDAIKRATHTPVKPGNVGAPVGAAAHLVNGDFVTQEVLRPQTTVEDVVRMGARPPEPPPLDYRAAAAREALREQTLAAQQAAAAADQAALARTPTGPGVEGPPAGAKQIRPTLGASGAPAAPAGAPPSASTAAPAASTPAPGAAPAASAASAASESAASKGALGRAKDWAFGTKPAAAAEAAGAAAKSGHWYNPNITLKGVGGVAKTGLAAAPVLGAAGMAMATPEERAAYQEQMGVKTGSDFGDAALQFLDRTGNAATFGYAGKLGRALASWTGGRGFRDEQALQPTPGGAAAVPGAPKVAGNAAEFGPPAPKVADAQPAQRTLADVENERVNAQTAKLAELGVPLESMNRSPVNVLDRGAYVRGETGKTLDRTQYMPLGDYGAPGTRIFGRASTPGGKVNDFVGVGGGKGMTPSGVDFGVKPGEVEAYRQSLADDAVARNAPVYRPPGISAGQAQAQANIERLANQMRNATSRKEQMMLGRAMEAAQHAMAGHTAANAIATAQAREAYDAEARNYAARLGVAQKNKELASHEKIASGQLEMQRETRNYENQKWNREQQRADNTARVAADNTAYQRTQDNEKRLDALATDSVAGLAVLHPEKYKDEGMQKGITSHFKNYLRTKQFIGPDGKPRNYRDMSPTEQKSAEAEGMANAIITAHLAKAGLLQQNVPARTSGDYDVKRAPRGGTLGNLLTQGDYSFLDTFRDGVMVGKLHLPFSYFPAEAQEFLKNRAGQQ